MEDGAKGDIMTLLSANQPLLFSLPKIHSEKCLRGSQFSQKTATSFFKLFLLCYYNTVARNFVFRRNPVFKLVKFSIWSI